jgi:Skp family chaperone for outer membrane proteins
MAQRKEKRMLSRMLVAAALLVPPTLSALQAQTDSIRVGVFDPETIWQQTDVGKKYNVDLTAARDRLQADIDRKTQEIEALKDKIRQQQPSLSEDKLQQMQKEAQNKLIELNRMNDDATREMKQQLNDVQGRFQQMLVDTIEAYGREKHYTVILNKDVAAYNAPQVDITMELIARFNEMHRVPGPAAAKAPAKKAPEKPKEPPKP